jgi:hypothetical protein
MKTLLTLLLMFSLFSCFKKKAPKADFPAWLEAQFPGTFTVVQSGSNYDVMDYLKGKKQTWVADKQDPDAQFIIYWEKGQTEFDADEVKKAWEKAKKDAQTARKLHKLVASEGWEKVSAGADGTDGYVLFFTGSDPKTRAEAAAWLKGLRPQLQGIGLTHVWAALMTPAVYQAEFGDVVPATHWKRAGTWQESNLVFSAEWNLADDEAPGPWVYNRDGDATSAFIDEATPAAVAFAEKNLKKPYYLETKTGIRYSMSDNDPLVLVFEFPVYDAKPQNDEVEPKGYVEGMYHVDKRTFTGIKYPAE